MISFDYNGVIPFIDEKKWAPAKALSEIAYRQLIEKKGKGNDFLGWLDLPTASMESQLKTIEKEAQKICKQSQIVVVIGIGGSYLGARAVIEALQSPFYQLDLKREHPVVLYAGNSLSQDYHHQLLQLLEHYDYSVIVISKSGTTTEPAIAFRILKAHCEKKYGKEGARERIIAITDAQRGALKTLAMEEKYSTFVIPDNVGGRYSVLTPVGLLPIAVAGFDIHKLLSGAAEMRKILFDNISFNENPALQYAVVRYLLYKELKTIELMVAYEPSLHYFIEWYKQLFGESDGKEGKGIFPSGAIFSTDLHSLGQYIQEGKRQLFETVLSVHTSHETISIPHSVDNIDNLNYLQHRSMQEINLIAEEGTRQAHLSGCVPNIRIDIPRLSEENLGTLIFFFEFSCAIGGYMLDINPFDQPGVEAYKQNIFRLLGKK